MGLVNDLINKAVVKKSEPARDSWSLGTVSAAPSGGKVSVTIDGDTLATSMSYTTAPDVDDRVVVVLLGTTRIVMAVIGGCPHKIGDWLFTEDATDPSARWPGTSWVAIEDRMPMGASDTYPVGSTGGEAQVTLSTAEIPAHIHDYEVNASSGSDVRPTISGNSGTSSTLGTRSAGGGQPHNNLSPYRAAYIWKRTA